MEIAASARMARTMKNQIQPRFVPGLGFSTLDLNNDKTTSKLVPSAQPRITWGTVPFGQV
jgi:hypothetical protein